jgi:hypothetical protein
VLQGGPFFVALLSAGFERTFYLALRECGFSTAAVDVLAVGIVETIRLQSVNDLSKRPLGCLD